MGDVLHAMPAVAAMRLLHPEWTIGWAIEPRWRALLEGRSGGHEVRPLVNLIHEVPTRDWNRRPLSPETLREILALRRELSSEKYNLCVDMQGLFRSAVVGRLASADSYAGSAQPRETPARWLYGKTIETQAPHVIDRGCELLGRAIGETLRAAEVPLPVDEDAERWCEAALATLVPDKQFVVLAPTAGWGSKCWPAERYGALAGALHDAGYAVLINAASENDPAAAAVARASEGHALPVACTLPQLMALLRRSAMLIAGDTGPLHLAAALGRPVIGLYGPTDPRRTGPYGPNGHVLRHPSSQTDHRRHSEPEAGLNRITVDEVRQAALAVLEDKAA